MGGGNCIERCSLFRILSVILFWRKDYIVFLQKIEQVLRYCMHRYVVATDRVLFMTQDGSKAWKIKDYLVTLEECTTVNFEHLSFPCEGTAEGSEGYQHPKQEL